MKAKQFNTGMSDGLRTIWEAYPEGLRDGIHQKELHRQRRESNKAHQARLKDQEGRG